MTVRFLLNGAPVQVDHIDPHVTLLQWLRSSGLTGTKEVCAEGECGACAVAMMRRDSHGRGRLEPINSCLVPLPSMHGHSLVTVEGVAEPSGQLHPVQQAMIEQGGSQCGYCTPGFVVSLFCEYYRPGRSGYDPEAIGGNLCRCTGYRPIADVAKNLSHPAPDDPRLSLLKVVPEGPAPFEHEHPAGRYARPTSLKGLFETLESAPHSVLIAGGTDLMVYATQRYDRFASLISLEALAELRRFEMNSREIVLGAGLKLADIEERLQHDHPGAIPMLEQLLPLFSSRLVRNQATLGGNLGHRLAHWRLSPRVARARRRAHAGERPGRTSPPAHRFLPRLSQDRARTR